MLVFLFIVMFVIAHLTSPKDLSGKRTFKFKFFNFSGWRNIVLNAIIILFFINVIRMLFFPNGGKNVGGRHLIARRVDFLASGNSGERASWTGIDNPAAQTRPSMPASLFAPSIA
jgi:hypothetical protein